MKLSDRINMLSFVPVPDLEREQQLRLLSIRNQQIIRESSYSSHVIKEAEHLRWIERLKDDPTVLFYAVVKGTELVGGVGLKEFDAEAQRAEWSFYVSEEAHGQGVGLALGVGALDMFFGKHGLKIVVGEALRGNPASLSYHEKLGFEEVARQKHVVQPSGELADITVFHLSVQGWQERRQELLAA